MTYLPSVEELKREIDLQEFEQLGRADKKKFGL